MISGGDAVEREVTLPVDAGVLLWAERILVGRGRGDAHAGDVGRGRRSRQERHGARELRAWHEDDGHIVDVLSVHRQRLRRELRHFGIHAARPKDVAARWHVRDAETAVPIDAAAEVPADLAARRRAIAREVHVAARRLGAVGIDDAAGDARRAHELHPEVDVEHFLAEPHDDRFGFGHGGDARVVRRRVRELLFVVGWRTETAASAESAAAAAWSARTGEASGSARSAEASGSAAAGEVADVEVADDAVDVVLARHQAPYTELTFVVGLPAAGGRQPPIAL